MSKNQLRLCKHILVEHYGDTVASIGTVLINKGPLPLGMIVTETKIKPKQVKKSLTILIHHNLCMFERTPKGYLEYAMDIIAVESCLRYPHCIYYAKSQYDIAAELIIEEMLQQGRSRLSDIIMKVMERLNESFNAQGAAKVTADFVKEKFMLLVKLHFVKRCALPNRTPDNNVLSVPPDTEDLFALPTGQEYERTKRKIHGDNSEQPRKKMKTSSSDIDSEELWRVNFPQFHLHFRDRMFVKAISRKVDANAGVIVRTILYESRERTNPKACSTTPISLHEIKQGLPKDCGITKVLLEQYLKILIDDSSEIVNKVDESGGGMYSINILKGTRSLCKAHLESIIQEKYGSKCLRIFRFLLTKGHAEQKQIEESVMVNIKESKEMLYKMYSHNLINATELCKTPDHAPARTTFLFTVDICHVTRILIEKCYKAICNSIERRNHEIKENKRLLDKQQRVEAIIASLNNDASEEQKAELEELISPSEKAQITRVTANIKRLEQCELQIDETLLALQQFLHYQAISKKHP